MLRLAYRSAIAITGATLTLAACSRSAARSDSTAAGSVDTSLVTTTAATPAVGPGVHVTRTDAKSVTRAMEYQLTPSNFSAFLAAADSLTALAGRDTAVFAYLSKDLTDAGSTDLDAGRRWLESNAPISNAINSAGLSVKDYFVESIAIAAAQRFMNDPTAAPPTPTLTKNAEFLRGHTADLSKLEAQRAGRPTVVVTPR